jgi:integrase
MILLVTIESCTLFRTFFFIFSDLSVRDLQQFINSKRNHNTTRKTDQCVNRFLKWIQADPRNDVRPLLEIPVTTMDIYVGGFLMDLKKVNGDLYEPDTLTSFHRAINRKLEEISYGYDLVKSIEFKTSKKVLECKRRELKQNGKGNRPNKAAPLTEQDEEMLWTSGTMGLHSPEALYNMLWYLISKLLGFRGSHESRQLCWGDLKLKTDEDDIEFLEWISERETKTRTGNSTHLRAFSPKMYPAAKPERCPIAAYKKFALNRPQSMLHDDSPFYLAINYKPATDINLWFKAQAMGSERLMKTMSRMAESAHLKGRYTNHSVRKTMCTQLLHANVAPTNIIQLSGHKNVQSLNSYAVASKKQQRHMTNILLGQKEQENPALPALPENTGINELTPIPRKRARCAVSFAEGSTTRCPALPSSLDNAATVSSRPILSSESRSQQMISGMFAGAIFNGPVNISFTK